LLEQIRNALVTRPYRPLRLRQKAIPQEGGTKVRVLSSPTIRDRVGQGALQLILAPIFEAACQPGSSGYRPKRSAQDAVLRVAEALVQDKTRVIDVDVQAYLDNLRHPLLLAPVAQRGNAPEGLHGLQLRLQATGNKGGAQGGGLSP
jgi:RNA-directed DNA polymerase